MSPRSPARRPRSPRILCAVCHVRVMTSPTRPMAWLSLDIMLIAPEVVQHVFGGNGLAANAALGKRHVLGNVLVEVMAHHQHVQMLVERVHRKRTRRVRGAREHVRFAADPDDVGRVPAAGALGVIRVDRSSLERGDRIIHVAGFVQRVGVDRHLHVETVGLRQAAVDRGRRRAPILVQLQPDRSRANLLFQALRHRGIALAEKPEVHGQRIGGRSISSTCRAPGVQVVALVPVAGPVPPPMKVVTPLASAS